MVGKNIIKHFLWLLILFILTVPLIQYHTSFYWGLPLHGSFEETALKDLTKQSWFDASYQENHTKFFKQKVGFRSDFVRFYNQKQYSFFNQINTQEVIVGKNNVLYDGRHINTLMGTDFLGESQIKERVLALKKVKELLNKDGKELLLVIAPNKARYFESEIPDYYHKKDTTNYEVYLKYLAKEKIDYIDFNHSFLAQPREVNLVPKYGIHWGDYGASLVIDSIIKYSNKKYNYHLPFYQILEKKKSNIPSDLDYDLGKTLNLLFMFKDEQYISPTLKLKNGEKKNLLVIGDSYMSVLYLNNFLSDIFNLKGAWYYNREILNEDRGKNVGDLALVLPKTEIVMIMLTEWNMYRLGFGVVEEINNYYTGQPIESTTVRHYVNKIRSDKKWMISIQQKAKERNVSVDEMVLIDAKYFARKKGK